MDNERDPHEEIVEARELIRTYLRRATANEIDRRDAERMVIGLVRDLASDLATFSWAWAEEENRGGEDA